MTFDVIVIGSGQAGVPLATRLAGIGKRVLIAEHGDLGGTCSNTGCTPTKTMIASARAAHVARRGGDYGFAAGRVRVDMAAVKTRKDHVVRNSLHNLRKWLKSMTHVELVHGQAKFSAPNRLTHNAR